MNDELEIDDWIKGMIVDENRFRKFYSIENTSVNIYIFFISNESKVCSIEKIKVELTDGILKWDKLSEIISSHKYYNGRTYSEPNIGVYNIDLNTKQDVIEFIQPAYTDEYLEEEIFKYWRFVKLNKDIQFKATIEMFSGMNSVYVFFNEYIEEVE